LTLKEWDKSSYVPPAQERTTRVEEIAAIQKRIEDEYVSKALLTQEKEVHQQLHSTMRK
jgi:hypothetical protein